MNLCVFQGTFNPIHNAHIRVADYAILKYNFDKLIFIPAYKPPHKDSDEKLSKHRLQMVKLAIENKNPKFEISDIEYKRKDKSYTYITICELYKMFDIHKKINFLIGTDAFKHIESWYESDKLKDLVKFTVFQREEDFNILDYNYLKDKGYDFEFEDLTFEDISSTELREKIKNRENVTPYIDEKVKEYIYKNGLYED